MIFLLDVDAVLPVWYFLFFTYFYFCMFYVYMTEEKVALIVKFFDIFLFCLFFYLFNILMFVITNSPVSGVSYIICICPGGMWNIKTMDFVFNATSNNISC